MPIPSPKPLNLEALNPTAQTVTLEPFRCPRRDPAEALQPLLEDHTLGCGDPKKGAQVFMELKIV